MSEISILLIGSNSFPLLSRVANLDENKKHFIHCFNVLDYLVPTEEEGIIAREYRTELRRALRMFRDTDTSIPDVQLELLRENDFLDLDDIDLEINAWVQTVFDHKVNYTDAYKFLSGYLSSSSLELIPLLDKQVDFFVQKVDKLAPLRYYYQKKELFKTTDDEYFELFDHKETDELTLNDINLEELNLGENSLKALKKSQFLLILASDIVSLGVLSLMRNVLDQIKDQGIPVVLVMPDELSKFQNFAEREIFELLDLGSSHDKMIDKLSGKVDYIISPGKAKDLQEILLETGYQIEDKHLPDPTQAKNTKFNEFLLSL